jgi:hypothetical protein
MKDEKLYTHFGSIRSGFLATPIFNFLNLGGSQILTGCGIFVTYVSEYYKFNNLSKTGSFVEIFQRELKKSHEKSAFLVIFSTKTRYCTLDSLDRGTKVGFKIKYNCYMLRIKVLKKLLSLGGKILGYEHGISRNLKKLN